MSRPVPVDRRAAARLGAVGLPGAAIALLAGPTLVRASGLLDGHNGHVWNSLPALPLCVVAVVILRGAYRPFLDTPTLNARRTAVVAPERNALGFIVRWSLYWVAFSALVMSDGSVVAAVAIGATLAGMVWAGLEYQRRRRPPTVTQAVRFSDAFLEAYRLRWALGVAVTAVGLVWAVVVAVHERSVDSSFSGEFWGVALALGVASMYALPAVAMAADNGLRWPLRGVGPFFGLILGSTGYVQHITGDGRATVLFAVGVSAVGVPLVESARRYALRSRIRRLTAEGLGDELAPLYGAALPRSRSGHHR